MWNTKYQPNDLSAGLKLWKYSMQKRWRYIAERQQSEFRDNIILSEVKPDNQ